MSDLISRSELLNAFNNTGIQITFDLPVEEILVEDVYIDDFAMLIQDAIQSYKEMVIDTIKNQPKAYDIDKVVKELEERTDFLKNCTKYGNKNSKQQTESYSTMMMYEVADFVDDLLEIVKQGGVSDDVCVWKLTDTKKLMPYKTSCGNEDLYDNSYKYCPYCGKKIKLVVE